MILSSCERGSPMNLKQMLTIYNRGLILLMIVTQISVGVYMNRRLMNECFFIPITPGMSYLEA